MSLSYRYLLYKKSYNTSTEIKPTEKISFCTCYTFLRVPSSHFNPETYQPRPKLLMTKVTSTCFRIIKTKRKTSTKPSWNGISEELSNRSTPVNINTGGEIGNTVPVRTWHSQQGWWGQVERRRRSCPLRSGDSFLRLFITEQRRNSNSDWGQVCPPQREDGREGGGGCPPAISRWLSFHRDSSSLRSLAFCVLFAGELRHNMHTFSICHPNRNS